MIKVSWINTLFFPGFQKKYPQAQITNIDEMLCATEKHDGGLMVGIVSSAKL
jgi:hypothetical protein